MVSSSDWLSDKATYWCTQHNDVVTLSWDIEFGIVFTDRPIETYINSQTEFKNVSMAIVSMQECVITSLLSKLPSCLSEGQAM